MREGGRACLPDDTKLEHPLGRGLEGGPTICQAEEEAAHGPYVHAGVDGLVGLHLEEGGGREGGREGFDGRFWEGRRNGCRRNGHEKAGTGMTGRVIRAGEGRREGGRKGGREGWKEGRRGVLVSALEDGNPASTSPPPFPPPSLPTCVSSGGR